MLPTCTHIAPASSLRPAMRATRAGQCIPCSRPDTTTWEAPTPTLTHTCSRDFPSHQGIHWAFFLKSQTVIPQLLITGNLRPARFIPTNEEEFTARTLLIGHLTSTFQATHRTAINTITTGTSIRTLCRWTAIFRPGRSLCPILIITMLFIITLNPVQAQNQPTQHMRLMKVLKINGITPERVLTKDVRMTLIHGAKTFSAQEPETWNTELERRSCLCRITSGNRKSTWWRNWKNLKRPT